MVSCTACGQRRSGWAGDAYHQDAPDRTDRPEGDGPSRAGRRRRGGPGRPALTSSTSGWATASGFSSASVSCSGLPDSPAAAMAHRRAGDGGRGQTSRA